MAAMAREFPGRFVHEEVSRADAVRAIQIGKSLAAKQLELIPAHLLVRAERARQRLARIREIVRAREATERAERQRAERERRAQELSDRKQELVRKVAEHVLAVELDGSDGKPAPAKDLRDTHIAVSRTLEDVRTMERDQTRDMLGGLGLAGEQARVMEEMLAEGRERQRADLTATIDGLGKDAQARERAEELTRQDAEWARAKREREERLREMVSRGELSPELARVRELMDIGDVAPSARWEPGPADRMRSSRGSEGRTRGISRER
jgi:hypothetical protein